MTAEKAREYQRRMASLCSEMSYEGFGGIYDAHQYLIAALNAMRRAVREAEARESPKAKDSTAT